LERVLKSDDPAIDYDDFIQGCDLPPAFRHWHAINTDDEIQVEQLWHNLRLKKNVIDYFLNCFVFPAHAKQFSVKLQASAWDLPLFSAKDDVVSARSTGFSGTDDIKRMLPLTITQQNLPKFLQTNAEVLTYLLEKRNREYVLAGLSGKRWTETQLLERLSSKHIRILIDAGAFILELDNESVAKEWLRRDTEAKAAIYFRGDNRAWVLYQKKRESVPLLATPFAEDMEGCLVYLDEVKLTRSDLRLEQD
jgi:hypothetical protein